MTIRVWVVVLVLALAARSGAVARAEPVDDETRQVVALLDAHPEKVKTLVDRLEHDPYGPDAPSLATVITRYAAASEKVQLRITGVAAALTEDHGDLALRLLANFVGGLLVYALNHNNVAGDTDDSNLAAIDHMLQAYQIMLTTRPDAHHAGADRLLRLQQDGKLEAWIHEQGKAAPR